MSRTGRQKSDIRKRAPLFLVDSFALGVACLVLGACTSAGPVIPDTRNRIPPPGAREGADPNDVFMRKPWEIWQVPGGTARYHREAFMLLPDHADWFEVANVAVNAADGSDVRLDYVSIELGGSAQSHESISVFVYRAPGDLDSEWNAIVNRARRQHPTGKPGEPFPLPDKHPPTTKQIAFVEPGPGEDSFVQVSLFHQGDWAIRYEITCPLTDATKARDITRSFLASLRARQ